jgi:anti-anti-sigma factor
VRVPAGPTERFSICAEFSAASVVLVVRGELDRLTAPELDRVVAAMVGGGHRRVVLDLAECDFIDASGLRAIADGAEHLDLWAGELSIRSPSGVVRHVLDLVGLPNLVNLAGATSSRPDFEGAVPPGVVLSRRVGQPGDPSGVAVPTGRNDLTSHLSTLGSVSPGEDAADAALRLVVALARAAVGGADGVSVSLRRRGLLSTVAASDQTVLDMDADQYATGEGPCVDASAQGRWFYAGSLPTESRWPAFTPQALGLGIKSILSSPLVVRDRPVGALNIYSRTPAAFAEADQRLASVFAAEASTVLAGSGVDVTADQLADRVDQALKSRQVIALAQGVMMERTSMDEHSAYTALRRYSVRSGRPLRERAEDIVASARRPVADLFTRTEEY